MRDDQGAREGDRDDQNTREGDCGYEQDGVLLGEGLAVHR
jgi:hypothetical protein